MSEETKEQFCETKIRSYLKRNQMRNIYIYDEIESTNGLAKTKLREEAEGALILAESQTAGHGRMGRSFFSPRGDGLYMTMEIKPQIPAEESVFLTVIAALAVYDAIHHLYGIETQIKWVNDIYFHGKKLCGILVEGEFDAEGNIFRAALGIGVNLCAPKQGFPEEIRSKACALSEISRNKVSKNRFVAEIINGFEERMKRKGYRQQLSEYREKSCLIGKEVEVVSYVGAEPKKARVLSVDDTARLVISWENGETTALSSGDVSIILK